MATATEIQYFGTMGSRRLHLFPISTVTVFGVRYIRYSNVTILGPRITGVGGHQTHKLVSY